MKHLMKVAIFVSCVISLTSATTNITSSLKYDCTQNGSIRIYSQNVTAHGSIYATSDNMQCNVSSPEPDKADQAGVIFEISGCNVSKPVKVMVMSDKQGTSKDMVLGGRLFEMDELQCNGVLVGGVKLHELFMINETEISTPGFSPHPQLAHSLKLEILKQEKELSTSETVQLGEHLKLAISVISGFEAFVESCNATDKIVNGNHTKNLVSKGNTNDPDVLTNFTMRNISGKFAIEAELYAFHFIGTFVVTIDCDITVCENDDKDCSFNVTKGYRRRRRNTAINERTMTMSKTLRFVDRPLEKDDNWEKSAAQRGSDYGFVLMIMCAVVSAIRIRL